MDKYDEMKEKVSEFFPHLPENLIADMTDDVMTANIERIIR